MLAFILIFGVSFKAILFENEDLGKAKLTLKYALFMAVPCTLLYWTIEFIKLTHSGKTPSATLHYVTASTCLRQSRLPLHS